MNFQFQYSNLWMLLVAIPVGIIFYLLLLRWKRKTIKRIGDEKLVCTLISNYSSKRFAARWSVFSLAFVFGVLALMNPRIPGEPDNLSRKGIDVVFALDLSKSMLATDVTPNRLEKAKEFIAQMIGKMPDDRVALVWFAGSAYLQMPMTNDENVAKMYVSTADPNAIPVPGTVISKALEKSGDAFTDDVERFKTVILITDGEDHDPDAIKTAASLADKGIMINTVGIGSAQGTSFTDLTTGELKKDDRGNVVITKLNEEELKQIAEKANGAYIHLQDTGEAVKSMMSYLSGIQKKAVLDKSALSYRSLYYWPAALLLALLLIENFISERKKVEV
ncbi:MAG: VWA domain-containing protein [Chitinophagales bacterium]|nr:VWA domain-containing protein [Chitinophagales bacterium]